MDPNDTASKMEAASAALAELFDEELRAMGGTDIASIEDRMLGLGHKAMACALGRALEAYDLRICAQLPEGAKAHDRRWRALATKMGDVRFRWTRVRAADGGVDVPLADAVDLPVGCRVSPAAAGFLVEAACDVSYARAARLLAMSGGSSVSAMSVKGALLRAGALAAESLYGDGVLPGGEDVAEELCLEADGTWFSVQKPKPGQPRRLEVKAVCAYAGKTERGGKIRRVGVARHACVAAPGVFAREAVAAVGRDYDLSKVKRVHVGSDGEPWCKGIGSFMPKAEAVGHLDPFHVNRAVSSCFPGAGPSAVLGCVWGGEKEAAPKILAAAAELGLARPKRTAEVVAYLENNMEAIANEGPSLGTMESENPHVYGVRMDSFPCAWSVRGASDMARLRCRSVSGRPIPRMTRERSMSEKRRAARERRALAPYTGGSGRAPESAGHGYEVPHRASTANLSAEVCYAANVDGGMVAIKG